MTTIDQFKSTRSYTEQLCNPLEKEDYVVQATTFTSPTKWHLAHTTWFFEEFVLKSFAQDYKLFDKDFSFIFNSYYNNSGKRIQRADRGLLSRPTVDRVFDYRKYVDKAMLDLLAQNPNNRALELLTLGINHEQQHQELILTDLKFMLGRNPLFPVFDKDYHLVNDKNTASGFTLIKEGVYEVGYQGKDFCYDNELSPHKVYINDFEISNSLVTNGEYIEFIDAGGSRFQPMARGRFTMEK